MDAGWVLVGFEREELLVCAETACCGTARCSSCLITALLKDKARHALLVPLKTHTNSHMSQGFVSFEEITSSGLFEHNVTGAQTRTKHWIFFWLVVHSPTVYPRAIVWKSLVLLSVCFFTGSPISNSFESPAHSLELSNWTIVPHPLVFLASDTTCNFKAQVSFAPRAS